MSFDQRVIDRFAACAWIALHGEPHDEESLAEYRRQIAREYARREERQKVRQGALPLG